ncbi:MAG: class I poly(R)-hydroxyalkanoic acid synthase [Pseudomonadota bacterium]
MEAQLDLWQRHATVWQNAWKKVLGEPVEPVIEPERGDRRFKHADWEQNQVFDFLKQSYLVTAKWAQDLVQDAEGVDERTRKRADFYVQQIANALSPSNFLATNPAVLQETIESNGENLVRGVQHLIEDLERGDGELAIRQTDMDAFEVGKNMALTPGKVVFQNDLIQLIQYSPTTETVYKRPLLIVPPWINKFYILDLNPDKSFISWNVEQGITVFVISWANPDARLARKSFEDYMNEGILAALGAIQRATGEKDVNAIGYCIGGTLLAATLAYMAAKEDKRIKSATFFTTQVDFVNAGELLVFVDEDQVSAVERKMQEKGYLEGRSMATAFNMLRSNDLIWSYVVNNYLLGKEPFPFDLLFWNADSTRMPAATHSFYLRECYLNNHLSQGKMELGGIKLDLKKVKIPIYNLAAREDHIAPLPSVFEIGKHMGGTTRLVVAGSGHIAGVVNAPKFNKYQFWTNDGSNAKTLEAWLEGAEEHPGSWWPDWKKWLGRRSGKQVPARVPGDGKLKVIEDAPGSYVRVRSDSRRSK